ncbi:cell envelope integrity EipB family protein [Microbaculum marinum]|uniref:Cell envelope integrity EipB family protein n=1 Tax=Microbaculum marinum TaxID=1764581 RepID=A0AAW9RI83_9HYPH
MPSIIPHRAIYDLELDVTRSSSGPGDIKGRLVFEATGTECEGFTVNTRFVTQIIGERGSLVNDLQSATWEAGDGSSYRFITKNFLNRKLQEETDGIASRDGDDISVDLKRPEEEEFELSPKTLFPSQHVRRILQAAEAGERIVAADVYDGSDTGRKAFATTTVIGERQSSSDHTEEVGDDVLGGLASWPVTIGYFDPDSDQPEIPTYEFSYDLFENGVSRSIVLDYGDFVLTGELSGLEMLASTPCEQ